MSRLAPLALCVALLAGCGGGGGGTVAHVNGQAIAKQRLDALVDHFRKEAQAEGRPFPDSGTASYDTLRNHLLGLLVYRTELKQAADRLGVTVDKRELDRRVAAAQSGSEEGDSRDTFARDSVEAQLLTEGLFAKVTRGIADAAARNRKWAAFQARMQKEAKVRYEPGYAPGS